MVGTTPVTVFAPKSGVRGPVVVIAHGFAGSQQLMQPFAVSLSRNGYVAVTFDFLGHGRNPRPLTGNLTEPRAPRRRWWTKWPRWRRLPAASRRATDGLQCSATPWDSDIAVRYAQSDPEVAATIAVSMFSMVVTATSPRNLLVIDGALEPSAFRNNARRVVAMTAGAELPAEQVTYGSFSAGTARRAAFAPGAEHISVLYSRTGLTEALDWLDAVFGVQPPASARGAFIDARGPWLGLLFLGLTVLGRPLCELLPRVASRPLGASLPWRTLLPLALGPAILTPLILWKMPTDFLHVGDYLTLHFALYGLLTGSGLMILRWKTRPEPAPAASLGAASLGAAAASIAGVALYTTGIFGLALDTFVTSFVPGHGRLLLVPALLVGTLPYFIADEWLTRGASAPRGSYLVTKLCFLLSLALAVAFNMQKLFFLVIIVPAILVLFVISGLFSGWVYRRTNHPLVSAIANAVALSWAVAATLPLLAR